MWLATVLPALAAEPVSLAQITVAPEQYKGDDVTADATFRLVMTKGMKDDCHGKEKGVLLELPMGPDGVPAGGGVQYEACVAVDVATGIANLSGGAQLSVTGTVRIVKMMGSVYAVVLDHATVTPKAPPTP